MKLNRIEISKSALLNNYQYLAKVSGCAIAPVLKSNAYGHGLVLTAKVLDKVGAPFFCVNSFEEALILLENKIKTPILIMGYVHPDNLKNKTLPFSYAIYDKETVVQIQKYQPHAGLHIFVDTGMHREGVRLDALSEFVDYLLSLKNCNIEGLLSHFGASEEYNNAQVQEQILQFSKAVKILHQKRVTPKWIHCGNSSAGLLKKYQGKIGNMVRSGIALYGQSMDFPDAELTPVLQVKTTLGQIKRLKKGEKVGYSYTFTAKKNMTIGVLPFGYTDGMDLRLSNKGSVLINGITCPIIGRVSMNITTIDISNVQKPKIEQEIIVFSNNTSDSNTIVNAARCAQTISYELLVHLTESTERILVS